MRRSKSSSVRHCFLHWSKWYYLFQIQTCAHWRAQGLISENSVWQRPTDHKNIRRCPYISGLHWVFPQQSLLSIWLFQSSIRERLLLSTLSRLDWPWSNHLILAWKSSRDLGRSERGRNFLWNNPLNWDWKWTVAVRHCGWEQVKESEKGILFETQVLMSAQIY